MAHSVVPLVGIFVQDGRPNEGTTLLGQNGQWAKLWKLGTSTFFNVVEIHEERHDANTWLSIDLKVDKIVMSPIVLTLVIAKKLKVLGVFIRNVGHLCNAVNHSLGNSVIIARVLAPSIFRGTSVADLVLESAVKPHFSNVRAAFVTFLGAELDQAIGFLVADKVVQGDDPGSQFVVRSLLFVTISIVGSG